MLKRKLIPASGAINSVKIPAFAVYHFEFIILITSETGTERRRIFKLRQFLQ
jgi:hypothetical protein